MLAIAAGALLALGLVLAGCEKPTEPDPDFLITFSVGEGSGTPPSSQTVVNGQTITLPDQRV
jgi:hypothetical protein